MLQKRQALRATRLQMRRKDFQDATKLFSMLTHNDLAAAAEAEAGGRKVDNPKILLLRQLIHCGGAKVMGSDYSRSCYRSEIWSTMLFLNAPSLWVTINPTDLHDPILQVFAGEKIDMDAFQASAGPNRQKRATNLAQDPFAATKYFDFFIKLVLETLFGISTQERKVITETGLLGRLSAHYGVVEAQGRGSLHLHMLLWLENAPSAEKMESMLQTEGFQQRVAEYIDQNIRAHLDGMTEDTIKTMDREPELAWSRPPNPESPDYAKDLALREHLLARSQQVHKCRKNTCLTKKDRNGDGVCKRRAPFPLSNQTVVGSNGEVLPKRTYGYFNNWNPSLLVYGACNNDIKFISYGSEARAIIWYITAYQTKKQQRSFNWSALLAEALAFHFNGSDHIDNILERNRLLVFRCLHALNRQIEQSGQQVMAYLLGIGDCYRSHSYTPLYWSALAAEILQEWPDLKTANRDSTINQCNQITSTIDDLGSDNGDNNGDDVERTDGMETDEQNEDIVLETSPSGVLVFKWQLTDYKFRGDAFSNMSFVDFVVHTWEDEHRTAENKPTAPGPGHPLHRRATYRNGHPKSGTRDRVLRATNHNMLANIVGPYLPRSDEPESYDFYCTSMLALLKPLRNITDLKPDDGSWANAFNSFRSSATPREQNFISGAQYYYQCRDAADKARDEHNSVVTAALNGLDADVDSELREDGDQTGISLPDPTEEEMALYLEMIQNPQELLHGKEAVAIASGTGLFPRSLSRSWTVSGPGGRCATDRDLASIGQWKDEMAKDAANQKTKGGTNHSALPPDSGVELLSTSPRVASSNVPGDVVPKPIVEDIIIPVDTDHLKPDQLRAFEIVKKHLIQWLSNNPPDQLLMQIQGEGGTGKSMVIHCITQLFRSYGLDHKLIRTAFTGIAASLIDGNTLHTLCRFTPRGGDPSPKVLEELRRAWKDVDYLIIDKISMVSRDFFERVSSLLQRVRQRSGEPTNVLPFGGINVIIVGDFHQFPPVINKNNALYCWYDESKDSREVIGGRDTYRKFKTVVLLQEQCRTTDPEWLDVLRHARTGTCSPAHLALIRNLVLASDVGGSGTALATDSVWHDSVLVTPRHAVRLAWNEVAVRRHCAKHHQQLLICPAEDTIRGRPVTTAEQYHSAKQTKRKGQKKKKDGTSRKEKANLPDKIELAVGMEVMVTYNVETDLDVTNGARGVVQEIILDRRERVPERPDEAAREVTLEHPPVCVLVKLARTKAQTLSHLPEGVIPIVPMERQYEIKLHDGKRQRVTRRQLPIAPAYAFTDYRSQGQTIRRVIVDIGRPPSGGLTPFNAYVALSRSSGQETIRLLRDFDDSLFTKIPSEALMVEDMRLLRLHTETKRKWEDGEIVWEHKRIMEV